jgi:ketosteroid isomerase-like protein
MLGQVEHYFEALDRISRRGATVDDVDRLLALLHPAVRYVHVEYEADFGRAEWREAFLGNLERGAYANGPENEIRVLRSIPGKSHLAVEYSGGLVGDDGAWTAGESYLVLFAFTEGRISLVKELW